MKKIPTLFARDMDTRLVMPEVAPDCEWVVAGEGVATEKIDGTACLVRGDVLYKRYDAKRGRPPPPAFIPAQDAPDPITGHWPGWLVVGDGPEDRWHREAWDFALNTLPDGTYELIGPKVQGNPYRLAYHVLEAHGARRRDDVPRDYSSLQAWFYTHPMEGIVWHHPDGRMVKIKRRDFGLPWPVLTPVLDEV